MEFLVEIDIGWPPDGDGERRATLVAAEARRAIELAVSRDDPPDLADSRTLGECRSLGGTGRDGAA